MSEPSWYEFVMPGGSTTHIGYVHEDGSVYIPEAGVTEEDFILAAATDRFCRLVPASELVRVSGELADTQTENVRLQGELEDSDKRGDRLNEEAQHLQEQLAEAREQIGCERIIHHIQEDGLRQEFDKAPRWEDDPIVIEHGWLDGRCRRCGETESNAAVAALDQVKAAMHVDYKGPNDTDASRILEAAKRIEDGYAYFGGQHTRAAVAAVLRAVAALEREDR